MTTINAKFALLDIKGSKEELEAFRAGLPQCGLPVVIRGNITRAAGYDGAPMEFVVEVESVFTAEEVMSKS